MTRTMWSGWWSWLWLTLLACSLQHAAAQYLCADNVKGSCMVDRRGWCYFNRTTGAFNCDELGICDGSEGIRNKKIQTCLAESDKMDCCCNKGQSNRNFCNYELITALKYKDEGNDEKTHKCSTHAITRKKEWKTDICADLYCSTFMYRGKGSNKAEKGSINACHSNMYRALHGYNEGLDEYKDENGYKMFSAFMARHGSMTCENVTALGGGPVKCIKDTITMGDTKKLPIEMKWCCCEADDCNHLLDWSSRTFSIPDAASRPSLPLLLPAVAVCCLITLIS